MHLRLHDHVVLILHVLIQLLRVRTDYQELLEKLELTLRHIAHLQPPEVPRLRSLRPVVLVELVLRNERYRNQILITHRLLIHSSETLARLADLAHK